MFERLTRIGFQVEFHSHARAILSQDFPQAAVELEDILAETRIPMTEIVGSGGGETKVTQHLRRGLAAKGWDNVNFVIEKTINGVQRESKSHEVDHVRCFADGTMIALEIEWNNKDPFFDRDLENFKRLHAEGAISMGAIVTRGASLQDALPELVRGFAYEKALMTMEDLRRLGLNPTTRQRETIEGRVERGAPFADAWASAFVQDKFGAATTHWRKLEDRVHRGVGNPCPLILFGLPASVVASE